MPEEMDYKKLADKMFTDWEPLFERHRTDADFFNMVSATEKLLDADDGEIEHSVHVILNDIADFTWRVETALNSAIEQVEVTSESKRFDTSYIERFIRVAFKAADKLLTLKGMYPFNPFVDQQAFRRGSVASKCFFHIENKELIPDITPWDTGYFVVENDNKGIVWTATKFSRSQSKILAEYPEAKVPEGESEVLYILTRDTSQVWIGGKNVKELPNKLGYVPVIYRKVPMGSMLQDKNTIQFQGESGIFLIRLLFEELERIASIIQSLNLKVVDQALQIQKPASESGGNASPGKTVDELTAPGAVNETPTGSKYELMPLGQLQRDFDRFYLMIQSRMQHAMSSRYPDLPQPRTATEILVDVREKGNIILPRLATRGLAKQALAEMFIKQTIQAAEVAKIQTVELGNEDWEISKLKEDYEIEFKYSFKDPRMDAALQSLATSQRGLIPDRDIRINTLQREDWQADERQIRWEEAERLSPLIKMNRTRRAVGYLADEGEPGAEEELMMLTLQMIPALRQAMEGLMTPGQSEEVKPAQPMIPLLSERTQGGQQREV